MIDGGTGYPLWFKLWVDKYSLLLDIESIEEDMTEEEKVAYFKEVGKAFINAISYFESRVMGESEYIFYKPNSRDGKQIFNQLKADINQAFKEYEQRVVNGAKGGRPSKTKR